MSRRKRTENQKEQDKKGKDRIEKFEERKELPIVVEEIPVIKKIESNDEYEEYTVTAYQNIGDKGWEKVEIPYKRKKR